MIFVNLSSYLMPCVNFNIQETQNVEYVFNIFRIFSKNIFRDVK